MKTQRILDETEFNELSEMWYSVSDFKPHRNHTWAFINRKTEANKYEVIEFYIDFEGLDRDEYLAPERKHGIFETKEFAQFYIDSVYMVRDIIAPEPEIE